MSSALPSRLLSHTNGNFFVFDPRPNKVDHFEILSYRWGDEGPRYDHQIAGVNWQVPVAEKKLDDIKRLMQTSGVQYMWVDCVCINQDDEDEKAVEVAKMYQYYKNASRCHILLEMAELWDPQKIVDDLKFVDHILFHMGGAALATEAKLTENMTKRLAEWADRDWTFRLNKSMVRSAAIELGLLNCYSTCISHVRSLFDDLYFSRVWTFQEMLLGKNITMWGMSQQSIAFIGELNTWMDLATDATDKADKLQTWIEQPRVVTTAAMEAVLMVIEEDKRSLDWLLTQVQGISSARTDIINGGPYWWHDNHRGVSNVFSAISMRPRTCRDTQDIFRGLLGVFSGLFTPEEINTDMSGDDIDKLSFNFFKQLSIKTERAWTKLAISSGDRGSWDWIPVTATQSNLLTTDCFAGVVNLGRLKQKGWAKTQAVTGIIGAPRKYMKITLVQGNGEFRFVFRGCNAGKSVKTRLFSSEPIPVNDQPREVARDETGRTLVQCATLLGSIIDPGSDLVEYRSRLLRKLQPIWHVSDPNAKLPGWIDRNVSGTPWENPHPLLLRTHNRSMNYRMVDVFRCGSRLHKGSTEKITCEVRINCGCTIIAPFSLIFEALTAVEGSSLGGKIGVLDEDDRIILNDGLGLVQAGDVGKSFNLVAFGGDIDSHKSYATACRTTKKDKQVIPKQPWPSGRALIREDFSHDLTDMMRDYGYVRTGGSGNLLICRNHPMDQYKIIGVCMDEDILNKKGEQNVNIR
ncbi:hypothetical protein JX265_007223 [Neoarthrinium moseri]|uniref:Heterokaryon incompatibility domain-containing protein n=1 Tax=Neoarthrinium moseri TaxID=1658444 RepID=A0A9P9WKZ1_9PEZI|nr:hypothetical protein JX265_007223 [Neoarthrinium moseri]